jgi:hypothetical protein
VAGGGSRILVVTFRDQAPTKDLVRLEKDLDSCNHIWVGFDFRSTTNHNQRASILLYMNYKNKQKSTRTNFVND